MGSSADPDEDILIALRNGVERDKIFPLIVNRYKERVYMNVYRMVRHHEDSKDIVQDVFIKIYRHLKKFEGRSKLYTWIFRIAANESLNFLKKEKRHLNERNSFISTEHEYRGTDDIDYSKTMLLLQSAVNGLPEKQRLIFTLRYFQDMSYKDMSEMLNISTGALKASYHHAVKKVEKYVKES